MVTFSMLLNLNERIYFIYVNSLYFAHFKNYNKDFNLIIQKTHG